MALCKEPVQFLYSHLAIQGNREVSGWLVGWLKTVIQGRTFCVALCFPNKILFFIGYSYNTRDLSEIRVIPQPRTWNSIQCTVAHVRRGNEWNLTNVFCWRHKLMLLEWYTTLLQPYMLSSPTCDMASNPAVHSCHKIKMWLVISFFMNMTSWKYVASDAKTAGRGTMFTVTLQRMQMFCHLLI